MSFEFDIKAIIAKATEEYEAIATIVPVKPSKEDGTTRGFELDFILSEQKAERKQLWDKLYEVSPLLYICVNVYKLINKK